MDFRRSPQHRPPSPYSTAPCLLRKPSDFWDQQSPSLPNLKWMSNIDTIIKKPQQRDELPVPAQEVQEVLPQDNPVCSLHIHHCVVWISHQTGQKIQRTVRTAEKITGADLPSIQDLYRSRVRKRAGNSTSITPWTQPVRTSPLWGRYRARYTKTTRHKNSLFLQAVTPMNI